MAVVSKKSVLLLLGAFIVLSIALRYPLVEHERFQTDSYTIHYLSNAISNDGYAVWAFHPLSYLGYYPFSYPSGMPFLMSELSSMTGMSIELSILVADWGFAAMFCLGVFVLARQFINRSEFVMLATVFAILGARFVDTSYWDGSARGPLVVLITLTVFVLFRAAAYRQNRLLIVAALLSVGCFVMHHMAVLLILFGLGYIIAAFQTTLILRKVGTHKRSVSALLNGAIAASIAMFAFLSFDFFGDLALMNLQKSSLFDVEPVFLSVLLNMAMSYVGQVGFILLFAVIAVPSIFLRSRLSIKSLFPFTLAIAFIPLYGNSLYVSMVLAPFIAIVGTVCISDWYRSARRKTHVIVVVFVVLAVSVLMPIASSARWNEREYLSGDTVEVDSRIPSTATYLMVNYPDEYAIYNVNTMWIQLAATSQTRFLSSGTPSVVNGDITSADVRRNVTWSSDTFPTNLYTWFEYDQNPAVDFLIQQLTIRGVSFIARSGNHDYFADHSRLLVAIDNNRASEFAGMYSVTDSILTSELLQASWPSNSPHYGDYSDLPSYMVYQSGRVTLYAVQLPV